MPQELVLRRALLDWEGLGISAVAIIAVPPTPVSGMSIPTEGDRKEASGSVRILGSPEALMKATRTAAELLGFALKQSAVADTTGHPEETVRLEVVVSELAIVAPSASWAQDRMEKKSQLIPSLRDELGIPYTQGQTMRAKVMLRLIVHASEPPTWFREGVGTVEMGPIRPTSTTTDEAARATDHVASQSEQDTAYYSEIALRRALKQAMEDLLPRYEYQELP